MGVISPSAVSRQLPNCRQLKCLIRAGIGSSSSPRWRAKLQDLILSGPVFQKPAKSFRIQFGLCSLTGLAINFRIARHSPAS